MAPLAPVGDPRPSPKPQPIGNIPVILLFTTCGLCIVFVLWRKADSLRAVVAHQLETWGPGRIRLSEDDGPAATEFLEDDYDEDHRGFEEGAGDGGGGGDAEVGLAGRDGGVGFVSVPEEAEAFGREEEGEREVRPSS